jgi:hypothetical protein
VIIRAHTGNCKERVSQQETCPRIKKAGNLFPFRREDSGKLTPSFLSSHQTGWGKRMKEGSSSILPF